MTPVVNVFAPNYDPYQGYGQVALALVWHLDALGYHVNALGGDSLRDSAYLDPEMIALLKKPIIPAVGGIMIGYPTMIEDYSALLTAGPFVIETMFESTRLPEDWTDILNTASAVSVPSGWLVRVMRDCGVNVPVFVNPLGISDNFHYVERGTYPEIFTFLALGDRNVRKGWDLVARAFSLAFGDDPRYRLIIKSRAQNTFLADIFSNTNIEVLRADYDEAELQALYARVHCYTFPTRGEGFGMTPREAAATGLPVLCTNWSGVADDLAEWGIPLPFKMVDAWVRDTHEGSGQWAEVDVNVLAEAMKRVATREFYQAWYEQPRSHHVANAIRMLYSWRSFAAGIARVWEQVSREEYAHASH